MDYGRLGVSEPGKPPSISSSDPSPSNSKPRLNLKLILIFAATLIIASAVSVTLVLHLRTKPHGRGSDPKPTQAISRTCSRTRYQSLCITSLLNFPGSLAASEKDLVHISVNVTLQRVGKALFTTSDVSNLQMETRVRSAYEDCLELLEDSVSHLSRSLSSVAPSPDDTDGDRPAASAEDVVTWLSAALTNQDTCTEGLSETESGQVKELMEEKLKDLAELVSNSLAIYSTASDDQDFEDVPIQNRRRKLMSKETGELSPLSNSLAIHDFEGIPITNREQRLMSDVSDKSLPDFLWRRLNSEESDVSSPEFRRRRLMSDESVDSTSAIPQTRLMSKDSGEPFPAWLSRRDRLLMQLPVAAIQADIVVSKDGNGTYTTIKEAIKKAPEHSNRRFIIYVRAGRYEEKQLKVGRKKTNLMFIGDGKGKTVITGGVSVADKVTTFHTASFAATGSGFMARDITFENYAGPAKHQAVALRVSADHSVVYHCSIIGYQDSLYVHSQRQFFRECDIYGTVDFIFGNAAVVFQNCTMYARKPMDLQKVTITAQSRKDPNQNTGISIHACRLVAQPDLEAAKASFQTFLGRPWKMYSRTVYMLSYMGDHIDPKGWLEWNDTFALDTLYYGEYMNYGPGGAVGQRVKWPGYRVITSSVEATRFTVAKFIYGSSWLPSTGVAFLAGLFN